MEKWHQTGCVLCSQNCGIEVLVRDNRMVKIRPDKTNPRSRGYICRKGLNVFHHQHNADRLTHPLKRHGKGFQKITWEQAFSEIAGKLSNILEKHGPRSFAYMGGGGQGCHFDAPFGICFMRALGSQYHYNALAQELTGYYWVNGRMLGRQNRVPVPDEDRSDMLIAWGWNGMQSHQMPRAPLVLKEFADNPDKILAAVDPRKSQTATTANIHLALRPGTDALLIRALISLILEMGWEDKDYIRQHVSGWDKVRPWFTGFDVKGALKVCGLEYQEVEDFCLLLSTRKWCVHPDLGLIMNRHSTLASYLLNLLATVCGRFCVPGGNHLPPIVLPLGLDSDERAPGTWRTMETGFFAINGYFPPNVLPEEILADKPERVRVVLTCGSNPLRSYADTSAYEKAFRELDLLVTVELAMTETARMAHYVLPARSAYESYDGTFFPWTPKSFFQMRRPIVEPEGEPLECGEIFTGLADAMGLIPPIPDSLYQAAQKGPMDFSLAAAPWIQNTPQALQRLPFILAKTLGREMGSAHLAMLFGLLQQRLAAYKDPDGRILEPMDLFDRILNGRGLLPEYPGLLAKGPESLKKHWSTLYGLSRVRPTSAVAEADRQGFSTARAVIKALAPDRVVKVLQAAVRQRSYLPLMELSPTAVLAQEMFQAILDHPEGVWLGEGHPDNFREIRTPDGKIQVHVPELKDWLLGLSPEAETKALAPDPDFPFVLLAGRHVKTNANTLMRNPEWNKKLRDCTLLMNPADAEKLNLSDGQMVRVRTHAGHEVLELEVTDSARPGQVAMPHGSGLQYDGRVHGANVNRLTSNTHRDPLAGTPLHRYVPCRVEAAE
ncbi:MAG: molybdopterin-dependent oxidoreductase [Deltaproteobacteria bacterium]|nr:molybdopterin-dependent oxidoreductase [Deltaproteobacteria bacterium]